MNRIDDALMGLNRIKFYLSYYENLCSEKGLIKPADHAKLFRESMIEQAIESVTAEGKRLKNQIERCNLYYQPAIKTKTLKVAYIALGIFNIILSLGNLKRLEHNLIFSVTVAHFWSPLFRGFLVTFLLVVFMRKQASSHESKFADSVLLVTTSTINLQPKPNAD